MILGKKTKFSISSLENVYSIYLTASSEKEMRNCCCVGTTVGCLPNSVQPHLHRPSSACVLGRELGSSTPSTATTLSHGH